MPGNVYPAEGYLKDGEIRLIRLLPGNWNDEIKCELLHNLLQTARPYHTLSYVWGSTRATRKISLDSKYFFVTTNLESALRHLRTQYANAFLWVDALCINQADIPERTRQVKIMGDIYRSSQSVLVFLGDGVGRDGRLSRSTLDQTAPPAFSFPSYEVNLREMESPEPVSIDLSKLPEQGHTGRTMQDTREVFSFIQSLTSKNHLCMMSPFTTQSSGDDEGQNLTKLIENLRQLMHAPFTPWWQRIWVVQEVVMPTDITVICGTVSAPWEMFARAASQCLHHLNHCCTYQMEVFPRDILNVLQDFCHRVLDIDDLRSAQKRDKNTVAFEDTTSVVQQTENSRTQRTSLITLLRRFRSRRATDPRDKVYALLSLVESSTGWPGLIPDYSLSDSEVYVKAALESIYESASLSVLSIDATRKFRQDLPTWVPDWEAPGDFSHNERIETMQLYDTCANYPVDSSTIQLRGRALVAEGKFVDTIAIVGSVMLSETSDLFQETIESWLKQWDHVIKNIQMELVSKWIVWEVLCAEALNHMHGTEAGNHFRRTKLDDELLFVTWSICSKRSPFYEKSSQTLVPSSRANAWFFMVYFLVAVEHKFTDRAGQYFAHIFEDENIRKGYILDAYKIAGAREGGSDEEMEMTDLIHYATLTFEQHRTSVSETRAAGNSNQGIGQASIISGREQFKKDQSRAWKQIPWDKVLQVVKPELQKKLGSAWSILEMRIEDQASMMDRSIASATKARRLFFTSHGFVGLGPADLEEGDKLFLIKGGRTPFVLRDDEKYDKSNEGLGFQLVGDCYAFGLMDSDQLRPHLSAAKSCWLDWQPIRLV